MTEELATLNVQIRGDKGQENHQVVIPQPNTPLMEVFNIISTTDWGKPFFQEDDQGLLKVRAGTLVVLNNRMIQAWDFENTRIAHDDHLRLVPVVAGG